jgi:hypothetical protein
VNSNPLNLLTFELSNFSARGGSAYGRQTFKLSNQNHHNFDGDSDRVPVYGRPNVNSVYGERSRTIYGLPKRIIEPFNYEKNYKNKGQ